MIVNYPELHHLNPYPFEDINIKLKSVADEQRIPFVNLLQNLRGEYEAGLWVSQQDQHPNSFACKLIASAIQKALT